MKFLYVRLERLLAYLHLGRDFAIHVPIFISKISFFTSVTRIYKTESKEGKGRTFYNKSKT